MTLRRNFLSLLDSCGHLLAQASPRLVKATAATASAAVITTATVAAIASRSEVTLEIDGVSRPITVWDSSVESVLKAADISVGAHDLLQPSIGQHVPNGGTVILRTASPYTLNVDGQFRTIWSTSSSADAILAGTNGLGSTVSLAADRSTQRGELVPLVSRQRSVNVNIDGESQTLDVAPGQDARTVLEKTGITLTALDRVHVATEDNGALTLNVMRVERGVVTQKVATQFTETEHPSADLFVGESQVTTRGATGEMNMTVWEERSGGEVVHSVPVSSSVEKEPTVQIRSIGTKEVTPEALIAAGIDPKATLEEKTEDDGTQSIRFRAPIGTISTPEEIAQYVANSSNPALSAAALAAAQSANVPLSYSGEDPKAIAQGMVAARGWSDSEFQCLVTLWQRESGWNPYASNASSGAYGIPQALPGSKMASAGADWQTNPVTQITWGLGYIAGRYSTPCAALGHSNSVGWY